MSISFIRFFFTLININTYKMLNVDAAKFIRNFNFNYSLMLLTIFLDREIKAIIQLITILLNDR